MATLSAHRTSRELRRTADSKRFMVLTPLLDDASPLPSGSIAPWDSF
ncbi:hypothetical protein [Lysobacter gummosus]